MVHWALCWVRRALSAAIELSGVGADAELTQGSKDRRPQQPTFLTVQRGSDAGSVLGAPDDAQLGVARAYFLSDPRCPSVTQRTLRQFSSPWAR